MFKIEGLVHDEIVVCYVTLCYCATLLTDETLVGIFLLL